MRYFKEGDKVTCPLRGHGIVTKISPENEYPINVKFLTGSYSTYTLDGRIFDHYNRSLYQGHISIPEPELVPIVEYTKNEVVYYRELTYWYIGFYQSDTRVRSQAGDFCYPKEIRKLDNPPEFKL